MLVIKVDRFDPQTLQAPLDGFTNVVRLAVDAAHVGIFRVSDDAELGGDDYAVAFAFDGLADELLVLVRTVGVGGIEKCDAKFDGAMDGSE